MSDMNFFKQVATYLYLRKPGPDEAPTQFTKYMHGINRISIFLFLIALVVMVVRLLRH